MQLIVDLSRIALQDQGIAWCLFFLMVSAGLFIIALSSLVGSFLSPSSGERNKTPCDGSFALFDKNVESIVDFNKRIRRDA